jgi:phosphoglycolate phosphatase
MFPDKKHIIFDFDETIATLEMDWSGWFEGMAAIYKRYDTNFTEGNIERLQNTFYKKYGREIKEECDSFSAEYENKYATGIIPVNQTLELIQKLESSKSLYVWSSNYTGTVKRFLDKLGIVNNFKIIVGREMVDLIKPEPDGFNKFFKDLGDSREFLMIGNSHYDSDAANNCGIEYLDVRDLG